MKRSLLIFLSLLLCASLTAFSRNVCQNTKAESSASDTEKYVYKTYLDKKSNKKELHIALTRPIDNLPVKKRPLVIGLQGSAFVDTCFLDPCYVKYSDNVLKPNFTPQGFVTASIQYRLNSPFDFLKINDEKLKETHYKAIQDAREAIKYIFANAEKFGVDTSNVFLVGTSAGAITALHSVYLGDDEVPKDLPKNTANWKSAKISKASSAFPARSTIYLISKATKKSLMIVHGKDDQIVPFDKGFISG
jgi:acetyl esterase/lipase